MSDPSTTPPASTPPASTPPAAPTSDAPAPRGYSNRNQLDDLALLPTLEPSSPPSRMFHQP